MGGDSLSSKFIIPTACKVIHYSDVLAEIHITVISATRQVYYDDIGILTIASKNKGSVE